MPQPRHFDIECFRARSGSQVDSPCGVKERTLAATGMVENAYHVDSERETNTKLNMPETYSYGNKGYQSNKQPRSAQRSP